MSFYTGYALSLYGRTQDRLSHVLVDLELQSRPDFYYPQPGQEGVNIILSEIPFVRMRYQVPELLLNGQAGFQESVNKIQRFMQPPTVVCYKDRQAIELNGEEIKLSAADFAFYFWMCRRKQQGAPPLELEADAFMDDYLEVYGNCTRQQSPNINRVEEIHSQGGILEQKDWFWQRKGKVHKSIGKKLGKKFAEPFLIKTVEEKRKVAYELSLLAGAIEIKLK